MDKNMTHTHTHTLFSYHSIQELDAASQFGSGVTELSEQKSSDGLPLTQRAVVFLCGPETSRGAQGPPERGSGKPLTHISQTGFYTEISRKSIKNKTGYTGEVVHLGYLPAFLQNTGWIRGENDPLGSDQLEGKHGIASKITIWMLPP